MKLFPQCTGPVSRIGSLFILTVLLAAGIVASPVGLPAPWGELFSSYTPYLLTLLILAFVVLVILFRSFSGFFLLVVSGNIAGLLLYFSVPMIPFLLPEKSVVSGAPQIGVLSADVEGSAAAARELLVMIKNRKPAIVSVSGVTEEVGELLKGAGLPVVSMLQREDGFGLALLSTLTVSAAVTTDVSAEYEDVPPVIQTTLNLPDGRGAHVVAFRAPPPNSKSEELSAELLIRRIFVPLRHEKRPYIVLGNLHGAPTSGYYGRLWWATGVRNAMAGFGYPSSCCAGTWWNKIPVNHVLYNGAIQARAFEVLPAGSGRINPVWAEF